VAVVLVAIVVSLVAVVATLVADQGRSHALRGVIIWMKPGASPAELDAVRNQLVALPYVSGCVYTSQVYDYREAKRLLPPGAFAALSVTTVPSSFRCTAPADEAHRLVGRFEGQPAVDNVTVPPQAVAPGASAGGAS